MFIGRTGELENLERRYNSGNAEFVVIYGRRRVGKTELIKNFFRDKKHFYFLADLQKEEQLLKNFSEVARKATKKEYLNFDRWDDVFMFLNEVSKNERTIVVFDEVGYINKSNTAFYSIIQRMWDECLKETKIFLILCGSSVSMMEKEVLGYSSPIYGRRTSQMDVLPLRYKGAKNFFTGLEEEKNNRNLFCPWRHSGIPETV